MSKKNKKRPAARYSPAPTPPVSHPKPVVPTEVDKRQDRELLGRSLETGASFVLNVALACFAYQSAQYAAKSADEAAGAKQSSRSGTGSRRRQDPKHALSSSMIRRAALTGTRSSCGEGQLRPTGFSYRKRDETGAMVTVCSDQEYGNRADRCHQDRCPVLWRGAYGTGVRQIEPVPLVINETSSHEATTFGKLEPGRTAKIYVAPLLLNQITRANLKEYPDKDSIGIYTASVYCRLVNASSYDRWPTSSRWCLRFTGVREVQTGGEARQRASRKKSRGLYLI